MSTVQNGNDRPQRTLIAYCALAERLSKPNSNMFQALVPFFAEACKEFSGELFDASKFSGAVRRSYGIEIPKLAALGIAEQLANEGILEVVAGYAHSTTYRYSDAVRSAGKDVSAVTENDVQKILELFATYCAENADLAPEQTKSLSSEFLERLLHIDSMRLLARREASITTKRSPGTLQINKASVETEGVTRYSLHLDYLVSSFLINLGECDPAAFETVSNIAFASMAAEAIACFREPQKDTGDLSSLTVLLDTPLVLDMLGVNAEYADYGKDLLQLLKDSGCNVAVLDHSVAEAENTIQAKLAYMRSGVNQLALGTSVRPNYLAALSGNVAERVEARLQIEIKRDPEINLHRRSQTTVGDIESDMNSRMAAWRNEDAKDHDRKSVWAMISLRDSTLLQLRICKAGWLLLTRNTPLLKISNDAWKTWLRGSTKHSQANIERWAPVSMTDKQFAGYVWARTGGGPSTISQTLLLAHCSAAVRPRADIKAKAYNLILEMHGQEEAQDIVALFEDREGGRALMRATLGDPEDVTPQRMPLILERVKLAAGEFAAARVREESKNEIEAERQRNEENLLQVASINGLENERLKAENIKTAQAVFEEQQRVSALRIEADNLKSDLDTRRNHEIDRRKSAIDKGFRAALREYRNSRWLSVLIFGLATWLVSSNVFEFSPSIVVVTTIAVACIGFWFVPNLLDPMTRRLADRRLRIVIKHIDSEIDTAKIAADYKTKTWDFIA